MNRKWLALIGALILGLLTGWLDFHATEVQGTVLLILVFSFALGCVIPERAWLVALFTGGGVPLVAYTARAFGLQPTDPVPSNPWYAGIVLPLAFAFVAAYAGALARWFAGRTRAAVDQ